VAAVDALRLVHAKAEATFRAGPSGGFLGYKTPHSDSLDALQICKDTYRVSCTIAVVKVKQDRAGNPGTGIAELIATRGELLAGLNGTSYAGVRFVAVCSPATGAGAAIPYVGTAQAAI
jgi:hypothetical protein